MTNYEANKEVIDKIWESDDSIAINKKTNEIVPCWRGQLACSDCLFMSGDCCAKAQKWLVSQVSEENMTVFEELKSKTIDEFDEWLDKYGIFGDYPWVNWWNDNYCCKCDHITGRYFDYERDLQFSWCELYGKCKFFQNMDYMPSGKDMVKMWLESEVENE